jgi:hypothetical protein
MNYEYKKSVQKLQGAVLFDFNRLHQRPRAANDCEPPRSPDRRFFRILGASQIVGVVDARPAARVVSVMPSFAGCVRVGGRPSILEAVLSQTCANFR